MGNKNSHLKHKHKRSSIKKIPEFDQIKSENERLEKILDYHLSNTNSIDRQHTYHFLKKHIFKGCFSSPIEDKLIEGGCKVLDIG
jgi:hypothetical protein